MSRFEIDRSGISGSNAQEPVFQEPWQAQAFALTVALHEAGAFTWEAWTRTLSEELASRAERGEDNYFDAWLAALEGMTRQYQLVTPEELTGRMDAWSSAYLRTPHGRPVTL